MRALRERLGLEVYAFAEVLGVSPSTIYRWELPLRPHQRQWNTDPLQRQILELLASHSDKSDRAHKALGRAVVEGLIAGGPLAGLQVLLTQLL